jgi:hypothetical protein
MNKEQLKVELETSLIPYMQCTLCGYAVPSVKTDHDKEHGKRAMRKHFREQHHMEVE